MHSLVARRIESALVAFVVFASLALAPFCQADARLIPQDVDGGGGTSAPVEVVYKGASVIKCAKVQGQDWSEWTTEATVGDVNGTGMTGIGLAFSGLQGLSGSIQYQLYARGSGWQQVAADGAPSQTAQDVEAVRVKLTGDVAQHYDVLYRAYMSGSGWGAWAKDNGTAGAINKKKNVLAVQVKLSAKTEEAVGKSTGKVGVMYESRFKTSGWQVWKRDGKTSGKKNSRLSGFAVKVDAGNLSGGVKYRAYSKSGGWKAWKTNGAYASTTGNRLEAMKIKLTGELAKKYNVYYRAYVQGVGWLDWAKNGATAGGTGYQKNLCAFQVKLVKKSSKAPGATKHPTLNKLESSKTMNGIDIASWQAGINVKKVSADFVIVKATEGTDYINPYFKQWANQVLASGKQLGIYHFAVDSVSAKAQADFFYNTVKPYIGRAVLFLDWENTGYSNVLGKGPKFAKTWLDRVYKRSGVRPLIYMSQSVTWEYDWTAVAKKYKLWVAQYLYRNEYINGYVKNPTHWDIGYWKRETIYQYSSTARIKGYGKYLDVNKFRGSALTWRKLAQKS